MFGDDCLELRPERWMDYKTPAAYMPFGTGRRRCMGERLAVLEVSYVLVRLLQAFEVITDVQPRLFVEKRSVLFKNAHGTMVSMKKNAPDNIQ